MFRRPDLGEVSKPGVGYLDPALDSGPDERDPLEIVSHKVGIIFDDLLDAVSMRRPSFVKTAAARVRERCER